MRVPIFGTRGIFKNCVFLPLCNCSDTLLGAQKPTKLDFQLPDENPQLWWLSLPCFLYFDIILFVWHRGSTLALLLHYTKFVILPVTRLNDIGVFCISGFA